MLGPSIINLEYWDRIFNSFSAKLIDNAVGLPSVSAIALQEQEDISHSEKQSAATIISNPYKVLISTLISLRTKDAVTLNASRKLFSRAATPQAMVELSTDEISALIFPAGFYKKKAFTIKRISMILLESYQGKVPADRQQLLDLPGVGVKTANLTLNLGYGIPAICVDTHVHRISNRMGWVSTETPEQTEKELEKIMPVKYWIPLNELLVSYGQQICTPVSPRCSLCPEAELCPKTKVTRRR